MFSALLAEGGYAKQLTISPNVRYAQVFGALVANAREADWGLWAMDGEPSGELARGRLHRPV